MILNDSLKFEGSKIAIYVYRNPSISKDGNYINLPIHLLGHLFSF